MDEARIRQGSTVVNTYKQTSKFSKNISAYVFRSTYVWDENFLNICIHTFVYLFVEGGEGDAMCDKHIQYTEGIRNLRLDFGEISTLLKLFFLPPWNIERITLTAAVWSWMSKTFLRVYAVGHAHARQQQGKLLYVLLTDVTRENKLWVVTSSQSLPLCPKHALPFIGL